MRHLTRWAANLHVRTKFLLILLMAISLVSATALLSLHIPQEAYDEQLYQSSAQMITLFASQIESELTNFESLSYRILTDTALQKDLSTMKRLSPGTVAWVTAHTDAGNRIAYFSLWFSDTISFQIKAASGASFSHYFGSSVNADELTPDMIERATGHSGRLVWHIKKSSGNPPQLFLLREIREIEGLTMDTLGTILIEINFNSLVEKYRDGMNSTGSPMLCAIYSGDICLYASNDAIRNLPVGENDGYTFMKLDGQDVLCVRHTASNGMKYVTLVDYSDINSTISKATMMTIIVIIAAMILAIIISAVLISSILKHLRILLQKFDTFAMDGRPVLKENSPYQHRQDEIGQLHRHFDRMTRGWDKMIRDRDEQQKLLQEKQMQQLRAQVRPHFLYNTLESIYCLAKSADDERIATMTDALGKMLRASLNDTRDIVTVSEDLQITKEYLRIQLIRYGDRLRVEYDVDERIMDCRIPAMTLQPLVENAVHHAAEEMLETCVIRISGHIVFRGIDMVVEDNGPGMDEDILAKLESGEVKPEGLGIGMRNIHRRVQYAFSDRYGLEVRCEGGHTRILIHLPETRNP